jgi:uncharacterized membrane protein YqaE (UPF0057 family)
MRYVFAFFLPPLSIAMCGRWGHFVFNLILFVVSLPLIFFVGLGLVGWLVCTIHALAVCKMSSIDRRVNRIVGAIQQSQSPASVR